MPSVWIINLVRNEILNLNEGGGRGPRYNWELGTSDGEFIRISIPFDAYNKDRDGKRAVPWVKSYFSLRRALQGSLNWMVRLSLISSIFKEERAPTDATRRGASPKLCLASGIRATHTVSKQNNLDKYNYNYWSLISPGYYPPFQLVWDYYHFNCEIIKTVPSESPH